MICRFYKKKVDIFRVKGDRCCTLTTAHNAGLHRGKAFGIIYLKQFVREKRNNASLPTKGRRHNGFRNPY